MAFLNLERVVLFMETRIAILGIIVENMDSCLLYTSTDFYDHAFIVEEGTLKEKTIEALNEENFRMIFVKFRPTAENFSKFFFEEVKKKGYNVSKVCVYETPNNCAAYSE